MSEPIIEIDYVFHFASGEPLFVTITEGRDMASFHADGYETDRRHHETRRRDVDHLLRSTQRHAQDQAGSRT
jgi:hypothetical protein